MTIFSRTAAQQERPRSGDKQLANETVSSESTPITHANLLISQLPSGSLRDELIATRRMLSAIGTIKTESCQSSDPLIGPMAALAITQVGEQLVELNQRAAQQIFDEALRRTLQPQPKDISKPINLPSEKEDERSEVETPARHESNALERESLPPPKPSRPKLNPSSAPTLPRASSALVSAGAGIASLLGRETPDRREPNTSCKPTTRYVDINACSIQSDNSLFWSRLGIDGTTVLQDDLSGRGMTFASWLAQNFKEHSDVLLRRSLFGSRWGIPDDSATITLAQGAITSSYLPCPLGFEPYRFSLLDSKRRDIGTKVEIEHGLGGMRIVSEVPSETHSIRYTVVPRGDGHRIPNGILSRLNKRLPIPGDNAELMNTDCMNLGLMRLGIPTFPQTDAASIRVRAEYIFSRLQEMKFRWAESRFLSEMYALLPDKLLPFIGGTRVGNCSLIATFTTAVLRAHGVPAILCSGKLPDKVNATYLLGENHAQVMVLAQQPFILDLVSYAPVLRPDSTPNAVRRFLFRHQAKRVDAQHSYQQVHQLGQKVGVNLREQEPLFSPPQQPLRFPGTLSTPFQPTIANPEDRKSISLRLDARTAVLEYRKAVLAGEDGYEHLITALRAAVAVDVTPDPISNAALNSSGLNHSTFLSAKEFTYKVIRLALRGRTTLSSREHQSILEALVAVAPNSFTTSGNQRHQRLFFLSPTSSWINRHSQILFLKKDPLRSLQIFDVLITAFKRNLGDYVDKSSADRTEYLKELQRHLFLIAQLFPENISTVPSEARIEILGVLTQAMLIAHENASELPGMRETIRILICFFSAHDFVAGLLKFPRNSRIILLDEIHARNGLQIGEAELAQILVPYFQTLEVDSLLEADRIASLKQAFGKQQLFSPEMLERIYRESEKQFKSTRDSYPWVNPCSVDTFPFSTMRLIVLRLDISHPDTSSHSFSRFLDLQLVLKSLGASHAQMESWSHIDSQQEELIREQLLSIFDVQWLRFSQIGKLLELLSFESLSLLFGNAVAQTIADNQRPSDPTKWRAALPREFAVAPLIQAFRNSPSAQSAVVGFIRELLDNPKHAAFNQELLSYVLVLTRRSSEAILFESFRWVRSIQLSRWQPSQFETPIITHSLNLSNQIDNESPLARAEREIGTTLPEFLRSEPHCVSIAIWALRFVDKTPKTSEVLKHFVGGDGRAHAAILGKESKALRYESLLDRPDYSHRSGFNRHIVKLFGSGHISRTDSRLPAFSRRLKAIAGDEWRGMQEVNGAVPVRMINHPATARSDKLITNLMHQQVSGSVVIALDIADLCAIDPRAITRADSSPDQLLREIGALIKVCYEKGVVPFVSVFAGGELISVLSPHQMLDGRFRVLPASKDALLRTVAEKLTYWIYRGSAPLKKQLLPRQFSFSSFKDFDRPSVIIVTNQAQPSGLAEAFRGVSKRGGDLLVWRVAPKTR